MKLFKLFILTGAITGCASKPMTIISVQAVEEDGATLNARIEKMDLDNNFCEGYGFDYYAENSYSYNFRCKSYFDDKNRYRGGGRFHLAK